MNKQMVISIIVLIFAALLLGGIGYLVIDQKEQQRIIDEKARAMSAERYGDGQEDVADEEPVSEE